MKIILYPHGGSGNHGCEAIVRSTLKIIGAQASLFSVNPEEDIQNGVNQICKVMSDKQTLSRKDLKYWKSFIQFHLGDKEAYDRLFYNPIFKEALSADFALSIGGDNYCYGVPQFIYLINKELRKNKIKTLLWGCSVEPDSIKAEMLDDLKGYTHIFARESITYQAMKDKGIQNVSLLPDPAFALDKKEKPLPDGFVEGKTIGINVSPMIIAYEKLQGMTLKNYIKLIEFIIHNTDLQVALIPHVVWSHNDDRIPLKLLYDQFKDTHRVCMVSDSPAEVLKGYIARCRFMIVARTHASIAAYSEMVPTLVVGYSVKARGIAKDIFGTDQNYVIPVQALQKEDELVNAFKWIVQNESLIKERYLQVIPKYKESVFKMKEILQTL